VTSPEVVYNGRPFRSHLQARWAVFYDALGIAYFCDSKEYDLDGMQCRPDFYLPSFNCFIVVQEEFPSNEEDEMYTRLSTRTDRDVYVFFGDVEIPGDDITQDETCSACLFSAAEVWVYQGLQAGDVKLDLPQHIVWLFYRATLVHKLSLRNSASYLFIAQFEKYEEEDFLRDEEYRRLKDEDISPNPAKIGVVHELEMYEASIVHFLPEGFHYYFAASRDYRAHWYECSICKTLMITCSPMTVCQCSQHNGYRTLTAQSPHLIAAYSTAKQAHF
jgi:hypothetical protein